MSLDFNRKLYISFEGKLSGKLCSELSENLKNSNNDSNWRPELAQIDPGKIAEKVKDAKTSNRFMQTMIKKKTL